MANKRKTPKKKMGKEWVKAVDRVDSLVCGWPTCKTNKAGWVIHDENDDDDEDNEEDDEDDGENDGSRRKDLQNCLQNKTETSQTQLQTSCWSKRLSRTLLRKQSSIDVAASNHEALSSFGVKKHGLLDVGAYGRRRVRNGARFE